VADAIGNVLTTSKIASNIPLIFLFFILAG